MEKIDWAALLPSYGDIAYEGAGELLKEIEAVQARQKTLARMSDGDGNMVAKLSAIAEAMSSAMGLEVVDKRAYTIAMPRKNLPGYAPAERVECLPPGISVFDIHERIARSRAEAARLDELTRLRARDEYLAAKLAAAAPEVADNTATAPPVQIFIMKKKALIAELEHEWPSIEVDLSDATRNGLKIAAHTGKHGDWDADKARAWAKSKGKLKQSPRLSGLDAVWAKTVVRNTMR